jgi:hypothetical protein
VPNAAPPESPVRGDAVARAALSRDDELSIDAVILRRFFRPSGGQARWIDPRPLADTRGAAADSAVDADDAWADAVRDAAGLARVCVADPDAEQGACRGRRGGVLRFSRAYRDADYGARVFVRYTPAADEGAGPVPNGAVFELAFAMARDGRAWRIVEQHAVQASPR